MSITNVENAKSSTRLLAQTTLRNVLGTKNLSEILMERDTISHTMQVLITWVFLEASYLFIERFLYRSYYIYLMCLWLAVGRGLL